MPIYEYLCSNCKLRFELLRPMSRADEAASCPHCHSSAPRALSTFACVSKDAEGESFSIGGFNPCGTCSALSCNTCQL